jgi:signal transduction histidine kinase
MMETRPYDRIAAELAALRRVAALVARGALPEEVFAAVAAEAGLLLGADLTTVARYDPGSVVVIVGAWSSAGTARLDSAGTRTSLAGHNMSALVFRTGRAVRIDDYNRATGVAADLGRELGFRMAVGVPITVDGRLWGVMSVGSTTAAQLPADTEDQLVGFTELVGTAIANAQARVELRGYAEEEAALRRVATLVARGAPPEKVFAAVAAEAGRLPNTDLTTVSRYDPDGTVTVLGAWSSAGTAIPLFSVGVRISPGGQNLATLVFQTRRPVRIDDYHRNSTGVAAAIGRDWGYRAAVGVPITVEGQLWGLMTVASTGEESLPADTEARLVAFTGLTGTAIANAEAQAALAASRARVVTAEDEARRCIERDLHDGAQQRLITLALDVQELREAVPSGSGELARRLAGVTAGLEAALAELREIAHGIHPAAVAQDGLPSALRAVVRRCPVPVDLRVEVEARPPQSVEIAAYYVVCEALANTAKHAGACSAEVAVVAGEGILRVWVRDDGRGGADLSRGSGLLGLRDRAEALGGRISLRSPPGMGTTLEVRIPIDGPTLPADRENQPPPAGDGLTGGGTAGARPSGHFGPDHDCAEALTHDGASAPRVGRQLHGRHVGPVGHWQAAAGLCPARRRGQADRSPARRWLRHRRERAARRQSWRRCHRHRRRADRDRAGAGEGVRARPDRAVRGRGRTRPRPPRPHGRHRDRQRRVPRVRRRGPGPVRRQPRGRAEAGRHLLRDVLQRPAARDLGPAPGQRGGVARGVQRRLDRGVDYRRHLRDQPDGGHDAGAGLAGGDQP